MAGSTADPKDVLTLTEAARYLRVSTRTIHRLVDREIIKVYRIKGTGGNNNRRYLRRELDAALEVEEGHRPMTEALVQGRA